MNIERLEWDRDNREHLAQHSIRPWLVQALVEIGEWVPLRDKYGREDYRTIIGITPRSLITVVLQDKGEGVWRPATGWPSTPEEVRRFHARRQQRRTRR